MNAAIARTTEDVRTQLRQLGVEPPKPREPRGPRPLPDRSAEILVEPAAGCCIVHIGNDQRVIEPKERTVAEVILARVFGEEGAKDLWRDFVRDFQPLVGNCWRVSEVQLRAWASRYA